MYSNITRRRAVCPLLPLSSIGKYLHRKIIPLLYLLHKTKVHLIIRDGKITTNIEVKRSLLNSVVGHQDAGFGWISSIRTFE